MKLLFMIFIVAMTAPAVLFYLAAVLFMFRAMLADMRQGRIQKSNTRRSALVSQFIS